MGTKDNHLLGTFDLTGIAPAKRGTPQIEVTFEVDTDGILNVAAEEKASGRREAITITNDKGRLTQDQIDRMIREAEENAEQDRLAKERVDARNALDGYLHSMRSAMEGEQGLSEKLDPEERQRLLSAVQEGRAWLEANSDAEAEDIKEKMREVEGICAPIVSKYSSHDTHANKQEEDDDAEAHD